MTGTKAKPGSRKLRPEDPAYVEKLEEVLPLCGYIEGAEHRGITYYQFSWVVTYALENCSAWRDLSSLSKTGGQTLTAEILNLYHVSDWVIKPATAKHNCSCVELLTSDMQKPDWFISHWWGSKVADFLECLKAHINTRCLKASTFFWICAMANRQHSLDSDMNVSADPRDTSFFKAMKFAQGILLILDGETDMGTGPATPFTRMWCVFEISMAILHLKRPIDIAGLDNGIAGVLTEGLVSHEEDLNSRHPGWGYRGKVKRESEFPVDIVKTCLDVSIERANATLDIDRVRILNCIAGRSLDEEPLMQHDSYYKVNVQLRSHFAVAMWWNAIQSESMNVELLAEALLADEWRSSLVMNFGFCMKMDDAHLSVLSQGLTKKLQTLELHFWMCESISNKGLEFLAKALPDTLETLVLNFQMCVNISNGGITALGRTLESLKALKVLRLNFEMDKGILSAHGIAEGIANLPRLLVLDLNLGVLDQLNNKEVTALAKVLPRKLKNLSLSLQLCTRLDNSTVLAIAQSLPCTLTVLNLNFKGCDQISNAAVDTLAQHMPPILLALHINFEDCALITEPSIIALVRALPESLYGAKLSLQGTALSGDKQRICRRLDRMRKWMPPVKTFSEGIHHRDADALYVSTAEKPLFLRSINHIVMASAAALGPTSHDTHAASAGSLTRPRSSSSLRRPKDGPNNCRPHSSQSMRRRKGATDGVAVEAEKPLAGTLHHYFHSRTSSPGWSVNHQETIQPCITRPVPATASAHYATSPQAMFMRPRSQHRGRSEPLWRPIARA